ncbi:hypothetical protein [Cereibacter sphaeroides]|jgi:hypothetical protein|uniref:hypothetical protein n=1 Tax=Cereibacter sphaeroides TaxID=1063 RepID=UPI000066413C|nr:hypothetical protein Rsph17029_0628 [Cereibacter sphaeroides ATCC 17029]
MLEPDAQPGQPYAWLTNQAGHFAMVGLPLGIFALGLGLPPVVAPLVVVGLYLAIWEGFFQPGSDWGDSLSDGLHVGVGAAFASAALCAGYAASVAVLAAWVPLLATGVWRRLPREGQEP